MKGIEKLLKDYAPKGLRLLRRKIASFNVRMKRGILMDSYITLRCNMKCNYCPFEIKGWKFHNKEKPLKDWIYYINNNVPYPIKRMAIIGGEPSLIPWVGTYVNFLLSPTARNRHMGVTLYTNLKNIKNLMIIVPSPYLWINVTYHEKYIDKELFLINLKKLLKAGHNIRLSHITDNQNDINVVTGGGLMLEKDYVTQCCRFRIAPDLTIHPRAWDIAKYLKK